MLINVKSPSSFFSTDHGTPFHPVFLENMDTQGAWTNSSNSSVYKYKYTKALLIPVYLTQLIFFSKCIEQD